MKKKILIIDDDPGVCNSMAILFREEGYSVDKATGSAKAEILIKNGRYDVCLFDYMMKGLNGIDLLKMTKKVNPGCSVFIISGMLNIDELCQKEIKSGLIAGIIKKPFDIDFMLKRIADK
ncbi:MAG: response regulator receiver protein [uncultured bacterium]|nr:MAG: response regulator receiver protein [uncultured bacterium]